MSSWPGPCTASSGPLTTTCPRLQAWLRLAYAGVLAVAVAYLLEAVRLISDGSSGLSGDQANVQALLEIEAFGDIWNAGLQLFGLHLLLLGWLTHRSGVAPRVLSVLLAVAGVGYIFDTVAAVLIGDSHRACRSPSSVSSPSPSGSSSQAGEQLRAATTAGST